MKKFRMIPLGLLAVAALNVNGCLEIAVKTKIADDGSSERTISVKRPTKSLPERGYPVPSGGGWTSEWKQTGEKDLPFEYVATKRFPTPAELSEEYAGGPDTEAVQISVTIDRSFEWFYTYVDYRETYSLTNPFGMLPARTHFTPEEINRIALGEKSDSLNKKIEEWDFRNTFEEYYARIIEAVGDGDAQVNRGRLEAAKEELFRLSREDTAHSAGDDVRHTVLLLERALRTKAVERYEDAIGRAIALVDSMLERRKSADRWVSSVVMPGALVSANGETVEGSEVRWQIESKQLLVTSVFMGARSRVTNTWAFAVTGAAALALLIPAVLGLLRRRKR